MTIVVKILDEFESGSPSTFYLFSGWLWWTLDRNSLLNAWGWFRTGQNELHWPSLGQRCTRLRSWKSVDLGHFDLLFTFISGLGNYSTNRIFMAMLQWPNSVPRTFWWYHQVNSNTGHLDLHFDPLLQITLINITISAPCLINNLTAGQDKLQRPCPVS